jgi:hypothetical protein
MNAYIRVLEGRILIIEGQKLEGYQRSVAAAFAAEFPSNLG